MPLPVITDVARVALHCNNGGSAEPATTVNVIHVKRLDGITWEVAADNIASELNTVTHPTHALMLDPLPTSYGYQQLFLTPLDGSTNTIVRDGTLSNWPVGAHSGDFTPQVAAVVRLRTALRGRSGRGRLFLGPVSEGVANGGRITATSAGNVTSAWDAFANDLTGASVQIGVASYTKRIFNAATDIGCITHTATQRRRNRNT